MPPHPHRPPELAWQVFRGSDAIRRGLLSRHHLRGASWIRLRQDVYADARLDRDHALACRAALLRMPPGAAIAGPSAAYLHGVEHAADFTDDVHILLPATVRADSQPGVRVHHAPMSSTRSGLLVPVGAAAPARTSPPADTSPPASSNSPAGTNPHTGTRSPTDTKPPASTRSPVVAPSAADHPPGTPDRTRSPDLADPRNRPGLPNPATPPSTAASNPFAMILAGPPPRTEPVACAWETAVWADPVKAVSIIDGLLRTGSVNRSALASEAARNACRPGGRRAAWVFGLTDGLAQSPPESHLRVRLVFAGLPRPVAQHPVRVSTGLLLHPDLAWPEFRVAVEYDGQWHSDADRMHLDRRRLNQLVEAGWLVLHVTGRRLHKEFPALVREIRAALVARGWRP
ncbi:hypothetical protein KBX35_05360 [Micromonospora sp. C32]|uniref:hypothetical protein n=1 Tax=unclassified Micromonospora TaxID=2617518 RepID=UPI001B37022F|nr:MULTISPECIES: hypothetical protein [unclassified Micromonospora]MBQ1042773.1 hypothetical protein [Micromonospora sp. C72]MBQ1054215.1 hypothetical protein [Micromonospora sp. C32]